MSKFFPLSSWTSQASSQISRHTLGGSSEPFNLLAWQMQKGLLSNSHSLLSHFRQTIPCDPNKDTWLDLSEITWRSGEQPAFNWHTVPSHQITQWADSTYRKIARENSGCTWNVLGGYTLGTLSISFQCTCNVLAQYTGPCPQWVVVGCSVVGRVNVVGFGALPNHISLVN